MTPVTPAYGWTFLVARGRRTGYQTLLAPDFLAESNEYGVLGELADADAQPAIARLHGLTAGDVVLAYRTQRLTDADLGEGGPLTDEFGRPLELLYGFAVRAEAIGRLDDADFGRAQAEALGTYQRFLADESSFGLETSRAFALRSIPATAEPRPAEPKPAAPVPAAPVMVPAEPVPAAFVVPAPVAAAPRSPAARRSLVLAGILILALSATVWFALLRDRGPVTDVEIAEFGSTTVDCSSPITLRGTIRTNAKTSVTYHWESKVAGDTQPVTIDFPAAASRSVQRTFQPQGSSGKAVEFTQTLVVDEPNSTDEDRDYTLTCK